MLTQPLSHTPDKMEEVAEAAGGMPPKILIAMEEVTAKTVRPLKRQMVMRKVAMGKVLPRANLESQTVNCMLVVAAVERIFIQNPRYILPVVKVVAEMVDGTVLLMERGTQVLALPTQAVAVVVVPPVV